MAGPYSGVTGQDGQSFGLLSATATGVLWLAEVSGWASAVIQVISMGSATLTVEQSNDADTWVSAYVEPVSSVPPTQAATITATGIYAIAVAAKFLRVRVSSYSSGTVSVIPVLRVTAIGRNVSPGTAVFFPLGTSASSPGGTVSRVHSAASTNATSLKSSAGNIYSALLTNSTATQKFFKLYAKASAPTVGTDTPVAVIGIPANGCVSWAPVVPYRIPTGIAYAITGAVGDADTTAVAAADVTGYVHWA